MNMDQFRGIQVLQQQIISAQEAEMRLSNQAAALKVRWSTHKYWLFEGHIRQFLITCEHEHNSDKAMKDQDVSMSLGVPVPLVHFSEICPISGLHGRGAGQGIER